jgi:nitroreductase
VETWDAITSRRNVRAYADRAIPDEQLDRVLEAGRRSPSSKNTQPWDFVLVTERSELERLAGVWQGAAYVAGAAAAIALIAPVTQSGPQRVEYDLGQATMSIMLAAADQGIATGHTAVADQDLARELLGFPDDRRCAYLIALGYPADRPLRPITRPDRRPFDKVVHRGRW